MQQTTQSTPKKLLYVALGTISLILGLIGIPLPVLPTTPFILLSAWCFYRSSPRFHSWLINHPRLGKIVKEYANNEGMTRESKLKALRISWGFVLITEVFLLDSFNLRLATFVLMLIGTFFILRVKTRET